MHHRHSEHEPPLALSLRQLARVLGVDRGVLAAAVRSGALPAYRAPRMRQFRVFVADGEAWLRGYRVQTTPEGPQARDPVVRDRLAREEEQHSMQGGRDH